MLELSNLIYNRKKQGLKNYTLLLGAGVSISSGCPSWYNLAEMYCKDNQLNISNDPIETLKKHFSVEKNSIREVYTVFNTYLGNKKPSIGFQHLAYLICKGYFTNIITTNFDSLLEEALNKFIKPEQYKVLVRNEIADDKIAEILDADIPQIKILKLHGDLSSGIFMFQDKETTGISRNLSNSISSGNESSVKFNRSKSFDSLRR